LEALTTGKADAALAASIFHDLGKPYHRTVRQVKEFLATHDVPVRMCYD
jgi:imidazole glycerol phosphate synthase subunit HisF